MVKLLAERTPAKINLCLRVTGRRADGYHELDSIFVPIDWCDEVRIEARPASSARVELKCDLAELADPTKNLAVRAASAFMREFAVAAEIRVDLKKLIPAGAGLGGGSSDAGAVLRMMAAIFERPIDRRVHELAAALGADVPFFLDPAPSRIRGIGEKIDPFPIRRTLAIAIAVPAVEVLTAKVFGALDARGWSGPIPAADLSAFSAGAIAPAHLVNDLAAPACALYPEIAALFAEMKGQGATLASMSGSGGAVFGIYADLDRAKKAAARLQARYRVRACTTFAKASRTIT